MHTKRMFMPVCVGLWLSLVLALLTAPPARAEEFVVKEGAEQQLQSRRFEIDDRLRLLQACLAVIQDIKFLVTESEIEPALLVATSSRFRAQTLTVSLHDLPDGGTGYRVRLSMSETPATQPFGKAGQPDYTDFYQDFFTHLDRELFQGRPMR